MPGGFTFMKGFSIYVKNDLLEPKHIQQMDAAVWLYLWLLDKMTSINENGTGKVLGNSPVTSKMLNEELGLTDRTYRRYVDRLKKYGYINTLRTPHGLIFTVNKASKSFKSSAKNGRTHKPKSLDKYDLSKDEVENKVIGQKVYSDRPKVVKSSAKIAYVNKDNTKTKQDKTSITNVIGETPQLYGKTEINNLFNYWKEKTGVGIASNVQRNRNACNNLYRKYGDEKLRQLIDGVSLAQSTPFAPRISDFCELQSRLTQLLTWGKSQNATQKRTVKI